jgi:hypothetical protein
MGIFFVNRVKSLNVTVMTYEAQVNVGLRNSFFLQGSNKVIPPPFCIFLCRGWFVVSKVLTFERQQTENLRRY